MKKLYSEKKGGALIASGNVQKNREESFLMYRLKFAVQDIFRIEILRSFYLISCLAGLAGTVYIIYYVITTPVTSVQMILIFLISCIPLIILFAGLFGFSRLNDIGRQHQNLIKQKQISL